MFTHPCDDGKESETNKAMKKIIFLLLTLSFAGMAQERPQPAVPPMTPALEQAVIDTLSKALIANYVFTDKARHMSEYLKGQLAKGAYRTIKDPQVFAQQIAADLQTACPDLHMGFNFDARLAQIGAPPRHEPTRRTIRCEMCLWRRVILRSRTPGF